MWRSAWFLAALVPILGCASPTHPGGVTDGGSGGAHDLRHSDGALHDMAGPHDAAGEEKDLAMGGGMDDGGALPFDASMMAPPDMAKQPPPDMAKQPMPDMVMVNMCVPQTMPCDVICQNCGVNLKCGVSNQGKPICIAGGNVATGGACGNNGVDDCVSGDVCVQETMNMNQCIEFCRVNGDCKNGGLCVYTLNGGNLMVCSDKVTNCDAVKDNGCANQGACYVVTPDGQTGCHAEGNGQQCDPCVTDYDCGAGYACFSNTNFCGAGASCVPLCHKGNDLDCFQFFETCSDVNGWNTWGICDF